MEYKDSIRLLRNKMILSQVEFAKVLGVSYVSVNRYENGHFEPTIKVKRKLAKLFDQFNIKVED